MFVKVRGTQGQRRGDILDLNGVHALRFLIETNRYDSLDPSRGQVVLYNLYEQDRVHNVYFFTSRGHASELLAEAERTLATLRMNPAPLTRFGAPRWQRKLYQIAYFAGIPSAVMTVGGSVLVMFVVVVRERRTRRRSQAA